MTTNDFYLALGRAKADQEFGKALKINIVNTVQREGLVLDNEELSRLAAECGFMSFGLNDALIIPGAGLDSRPPPDPPPADIIMGPGADPNGRGPPEAGRKLMEKQLQLRTEIMEASVRVVKDTFNKASGTYRTIMMMNMVMFGTGIGLFLFAALYGVFASEKEYSLIFGGLGAATFVALFMLGPIDKVQRALSNLVQVEIAFMNHFDQMTFWEGYANFPHGNPPRPDPAAIEKASEMLQKRSRETVDLLQVYVEGNGTPRPQNEASTTA
ncbi:MAG: hypothetical protein ACT4PT_12940 [Methanobacteriota archaeon]